MNDEDRTILLVGSGPIRIGQAAEFDYSGAQACRALQEEGARVVLVNSNPATIMTDPETADEVYVEPITPEAMIVAGFELTSTTRAPSSWSARHACAPE